MSLTLKQCVAGLMFFASAMQIAFAADPSKVVRMPFPAADHGFDMVRTINNYSGWVSENIFEPLLTYDYLARPAKLVPNTAEAMPDIADEGKTYTFRIKKGIYFTADPAFNGARRELKAGDYAYTIKRMLDPQNRSPAAGFIQGKIAGLDARYRKGVALPPGPERARLYAQMNRQMEADIAWVVHTWRIRNWLTRPWIKGFKKHPILHSEWQYIDVERH